MQFGSMQKEKKKTTRTAPNAEQDTVQYINLPKMKAGKCERIAHMIHPRSSRTWHSADVSKTSHAVRGVLANKQCPASFLKINA